MRSASTTKLKYQSFNLFKGAVCSFSEALLMEKQYILNWAIFIYKQHGSPNRNLVLPFAFLHCINLKYKKWYVYFTKYSHNILKNKMRRCEIGFRPKRNDYWIKEKHISLSSSILYGGGAVWSLQKLMKVEKHRAIRERRFDGFTDYRHLNFII